MTEQPLSRAMTSEELAEYGRHSGEHLPLATTVDRDAGPSARAAGSIHRPGRTPTTEVPTDLRKVRLPEPSPAPDHSE